MAASHVWERSHASLSRHKQHEKDSPRLTNGDGHTGSRPFFIATTFHKPTAFDTIAYPGSFSFLCGNLQSSNCAPNACGRFISSADAVTLKILQPLQWDTAALLPFDDPCMNPVLCLGTRATVRYCLRLPSANRYDHGFPYTVYICCIWAVSPASDSAYASVDHSLTPSRGQVPLNVPIK